MNAAAEAAALRAQSKEKAESSQADKVLFDKSKRQSMLSESMRRGAPTVDTTKQVHEEVQFVPDIVAFECSYLHAFSLYFLVSCSSADTDWEESLCLARQAVLRVLGGY